MRFLLGCLGAIIGIVIGVLCATLICTLITGGDWFGAGLYLMIAGPIGFLVGLVFGVILAMRCYRFLLADESEGATRRRKAYLIASLALGIPALIAGGIWYDGKLTGTPSDDTLLSHFQQHRATFDQIIRMSQVDRRLERVDYDWTQPDNPQTIGVSPARIGEYRRLLDSAGVHRGFTAWGGAGEIDFLYWLQGSAITSDTDKGFAYLLKPPAHTLASLDHCGIDDLNGVEAYRHITGHWYLYYRYLPG